MYLVEIGAGKAKYLPPSRLKERDQTRSFSNDLIVLALFTLQLNQ